MSIFKFDRQSLLAAVQIPFRPIQYIVVFFIDKQPPIRHTLPSRKQVLIPSFWQESSHLALKQRRQMNKRKHPRLIKSFIVKVKTQGSQIAKWDMPVLIDISEGGCRFYGSQAYEIGTYLDMQIQIPKSPVPIPFIAKVSRVQSNKIFDITRYEISVSMSTSEHDMKKKFIESLRFFFQSD